MIRHTKHSAHNHISMCQKYVTQCATTVSCNNQINNETYYSTTEVGGEKMIRPITLTKFLNLNQRRKKKILNFLKLTKLIK